MDLDKLRQEIDEIDTQMCDLFARRMQVVSGIGKYKKENNLPVYHPSRARAVLQNVSKRLGPEFEGYGRTLYRTIFDLSAVTTELLRYFSREQIHSGTAAR